MENYTFEDMWLDLKNGYQIYYTYVRNRYVLFKTAKNCYTQKLLTDNPKNPQPRMTMLTLKRVKEMFPYMEDIEYKIMDNWWNKELEIIEKIYPLLKDRILFGVGNIHGQGEEFIEKLGQYLLNDKNVNRKDYVINYNEYIISLYAFKRLNGGKRWTLFSKKYS